MNIEDITFQVFWVPAGAANKGETRDWPAWVELPSDMPFFGTVYRRRNLIERLFCRLKNWRRLATRYDRLARNYIAALALVSVVIEWI